MTQALIKINTVVGSNDNLTINTLVQLDNQNNGGELTYLWTILDQPPGSTDSLSSTTIQNPTFTPKKEGTYLIKLVVNSTLPSEQSNSVVAAVRQVKTTERIPAAGETTQDDAVHGWATSVNSLLRRYDGMLADPGVMVGSNASGGVLTHGDIVRATSSVTIKVGLPGQEVVPGFVKAPATVQGNVDELLMIVETDIFGSTTVASNALMRLRYIGRIATITTAGAVGDTVFVSDTATIDNVAGTIQRQAGSIMATAAGIADIWFDGVGSLSITPINAPYVIYGAPSLLTNAHRIDGINAQGAVGGLAHTFLAGDVGTASLVAKRFSSAGADLFQGQTEAAVVLAKVRADGTVVITSDLAVNPGLAVTSLASGGQTGITGRGGDVAGVGIVGTGGQTSGSAVGVSGVGGLPNGAGVTGLGQGANTGVVGTGGATNGVGTAGLGVGTGAGTTGLGGPTGGIGVQGTGGATSGSGTGVQGIGGAPDGAGVNGQGTGTNTGVIGTGGATNGVGIAGIGVGSGTGTTGTGGATSGIGVQGTGGATSGSAAGVQGVGGAPNGTGVQGFGTGASGAGTTGTGGATGGTGVIAVAGQTSGSGVGINALGGPPNGPGGTFQGVGIGNGATGTGGASGGIGFAGTGGASAGGHGVSGTAGGVDATNVGVVGTFNGLSGSAGVSGTGAPGVAAAASGTTRGALSLNTQSVDPTAAVVGDAYVNTTTGRWSIFTGTSWERLGVAFSASNGANFVLGAATETIATGATYTVPANMLRVGSTIRVRGSARLTIVGGGTNLIWRIRLGGVAGTVLAVSATVVAPVVNVFHIFDTSWVITAVGAGGTMCGTGFVFQAPTPGGGAVAANNASLANLGAVNTTVTNTLVITAIETVGGSTVNMNHMIVDIT